MTIETKHNPFTGNESYWWYRAKAKFLGAYFSEYVSPDAKVLDIGSADGPAVAFIDEILAKGKGKKIAMDIVPDGLGPDDILGSVEDIPLSKNKFDIVSAFDVIEHVENEDKGLREILRVLKPGGYFLMSVPAHQWAWTKHDDELYHKRRYTVGRARKALEKAGFIILKSSYGFSGTFPIFFAQRIFAKITRSYSGETPEVSATQDRILTNLCERDLKKFKRGKSFRLGSSVFIAGRKPIQ